MSDEMTAPAPGETPRYRRSSLVADRFREQRAGERTPGAVGVRPHRLRHSAEERRSPLGRGDVASEAEDGGIVERRVAMRIAARSVHE